MKTWETNQERNILTSTPLALCLTPPSTHGAALGLVPPETGVRISLETDLTRDAAHQPQKIPAHVTPFIDLTNMEGHVDAILPAPVVPVRRNTGLVTMDVDIRREKYTLLPLRRIDHAQNIVTEVKTRAAKENQSIWRYFPV
eukprot:TRINITY_DN962_c0_g1_i2.p1 TRINITY_DN962_c0_g1~~TRINITY_DN962_c0_g1_i2.p1  ORF type:complete len:142 (-),score=22.93 TRINITY_DN962_c0_g1_i2:149-574(-)